MTATYRNPHLRTLEEKDEEKLQEVRTELDEHGKDTTPDLDYIADVDEALSVVAPPAPNPTVANCNGSYSGQVNTPIQFSSAGSSGDNISFLWNIGGTEYTVANPVHTFTRSKTYNVSLTVIGDGGQDVDTTTCAVTPFAP
jgi:PKD repeat protein